jgi:hypothetical protein
MSERLTRRRLLGRGGAAAGTAALGGIAGSALAATAAQAQDDDDKPNVLLIVASGIRADSVGAFDGAFDDNAVASTPNLDDLAGTPGACHRQALVPVPRVAPA